jgi:hypothetical protein
MECLEKNVDKEDFSVEVEWEGIQGFTPLIAKEGERRLRGVAWYIK